MDFKISYVNPANIFRNAANYRPEKIISNGRIVQEFEEKAAEKLQSKYAVACSSGTIALFCVWESLGVRGKAILMPSFTWRSTADAARMSGATPFFVDIDPKTMCFDLDVAALLESGANTQIAAICAVDVFGCPADYDLLEKLSTPYVIDSAHSFGSKFRGDGIGKYGIHCFSLSPTKVLIANEGGLITCNDASLAESLKTVRRWAGRMTEYNAACALEGLKNLDNVIVEKNRIAEFYRGMCAKLDLQCQEIPDHCSSTYKDFIVVCHSQSERDALKDTLEKTGGIETKIYFEPAHKIEKFKYCPKTPLYETEEIFNRSLCLPSWVGIDCKYVASVVEKHFIERTTICPGTICQTNSAIA